MITRTLAYLRRNAVACVALFIALGGTATASHLVVQASDIQNDAVRARHIQQNSVRQEQIHQNNLARVFGRGVVGGQGQLGFVGSNLGGSALGPPMGGGTEFAMPMPRRARVRDLIARSDANLVRPVRVQLRNDADVVLECEIPAGSAICDAGNAAAVFQRGDLFSVRFFAPGHPTAMGITSYEYSYRISP